MSKHATADFDYAKIDEDLGLTVPHVRVHPLVVLRGRIVPLARWVSMGKGTKGVAIRAQALYYILTAGTPEGGRVNQPQLAKSIGVTKAALSRACVEFGNDFGLDDWTKAVLGMRSKEACDNMARKAKG